MLVLELLVVPELAFQPQAPGVTLPRAPGVTLPRAPGVTLPRAPQPLFSVLVAWIPHLTQLIGITAITWLKRRKQVMTSMTWTMAGC